MKIVELIRLEESKEGTIGVLKIDKQVFCATLEPPDRENESNRSSIPAQQYQCDGVRSPKYGHTFEVTDVPGRSHVLFHAGNTVDHTKGCIILGEHTGKLKTRRAVLNSGATFDRFMDEMYDEQMFHLTIREVY